MPWKECHVMDERLRVVARLLDGEKMAALCDEFGSPGRRGTRSSTATKMPGWWASPIGAAGRTAMPTSSRWRSRSSSSG